MGDATPTRRRLIEAGMQQFAARGFRATAVGDIESAAGLQPRRGALYKHFSSKRELLEAAVRTSIDRASVGANEIAELDLGSIAGDESNLGLIVMALGRWFLDEMDRLQDLTGMLEHDGPNMDEFVDEIKDKVVDLSYRTAATLISAANPTVTDAEAHALLILGPLVALRRTEWTFGSPPLNIDDDRALEAWTQLTISLLNPRMGQVGA